MATINGKKVSDKELIALKKTWDKKDKIFWKNIHKQELKRAKKALSELKKLPKSPLRDRIVKSKELEVKKLMSKKV